MLQLLALHVLLPILAQHCLHSLKICLKLAVDLKILWVGVIKEQLHVNYQSIITSSKGVPKIYIDTWEPKNAIIAIIYST